MTGTTEKPSNSGVLQVRYENDTVKTEFLEVRAHFPSHEATLAALIKFWKDNNKPGLSSSQYHLK